MIFLIWDYAFEGGGDFIHPPSSSSVLCTIYIASLLMHLNVEKDVRNGISMMKYAVNHPKNFKNVHTAFFIGFLSAICSLTIEMTVILVLVSLKTVPEVIMKYVSLCAITHLPRFYYSSLVEHKLLDVNKVVLNITNHRH
jgi:hypothetical protein